MQVLKIQSIKMQAWLMQCIFCLISAIKQAFLFKKMFYLPLLYSNCSIVIYD